jgi:hypothetical protein
MRLIGQSTACEAPQDRSRPMQRPLFANDAIRDLQLGCTQKKNWLWKRQTGSQRARGFWVRSWCRFYTENAATVSISKPSNTRDSSSDDQIRNAERAPTQPCIAITR